LSDLILFSSAKINLRLEILRKREDGYHEIETILQKISLYDELSFKITSQKGIQVAVDDPSIPTGAENLAYQAVLVLAESQKISPAISIHIKKRIPAGAGMGGGSSNAATTLRGLNTLLHFGLSDATLQKLAIQVGADVPFFLFSNTALARGIGEELHPLTLKQRLWFLVIYPNVSISTAWAYKQFKILTKKRKHIKFTDSIISLQDAISQLYNDLEAVVMPKHPEIEKIKNDLMQGGAKGSLMSGSGSAVFGIFTGKEDAEKALSQLALPQKLRAFIVHTI
jgi:4-diphosphocytidyl-2-C-methyl-D-erythritol kinase